MIKGKKEPVTGLVIHCALLTALLLGFIGNARAADGALSLQDLINEVENNHEVLSSEARALASTYRVPQAGSLPDPMFMFGYQNEGWKQYTYGKAQGAQWMYSASQMFPFPGKRALKGEMASKDAESLGALHNAAKLRIIARVKELYYDLFFTYKNIDLIKDRTILFSRVEDAALARYSTGMAPQQEVIMAQTEKYMLLEKEEMLKQKVQSLEAMLNATVGRDVNAPLGRPAEVLAAPYARSMDELIHLAYLNSPEIRSREKMAASAEVKVKMAQKEYYPDFTVAASLFKRKGEFEDMWSLTTTINIPLYYRTKQRQAVHEAEASLSEARHELEGARSMLSSSIRDNFSMFKTTERLMDLYKSGLIPKAYQDFELALSGYVTGKVEAITTISRLKTILDLEISYWNQFAEREKAIARLEALTGITDSTSGDNKNEKK
ncbi:MAG: TolC family protein [Nitrospirae bacterium]|nr:TolC family protein [Nitrospirota bacterium]MCL5237609.1 TolC family protein [Nitrospirota bacterium]